MEEHRDFAAGRLNCASGKDVHRKLWSELANKLNAAGYGEKTIEKWQKVCIIEILKLHIYTNCNSVLFLDMERL